MGCACNKGKSAPTLADRKADAARKAEATGTSARVPGPQPTARTTPIVTGTTQSFALQSGDKTVRFGSRIERDAAAARTGGRIV